MQLNKWPIVPETWPGQHVISWRNSSEQPSGGRSDRKNRNTFAVSTPSILISIVTFLPNVEKKRTTSLLHECNTSSPNLVFLAHTYCSMIVVRACVSIFYDVSALATCNNSSQATHLHANCLCSFAPSRRVHRQNSDLNHNPRSHQRKRKKLMDDNSHVVFFSCLNKRRLFGFSILPLP